MTESQAAAQRDKLMSDLKLVIEDAEELLHLTAGQTGEKVAEMRARIQDRMQRARAELGRLQDAAVHQARQAVRATDEFVHERPWTSIGIAAGVGMLVGMLIARR
ncbi:DUF883 family protein [Ramlibacter sp. MAHUQ-53]|uniref:DUF883 family protein n=1 Tax=unclassified Ramlibacter TaxID=2617605 RepID=UPI00362BC76A